MTLHRNQPYLPLVFKETRKGVKMFPRLGPQKAKTTLMSPFVHQPKYQNCGLQISHREAEIQRRTTPLHLSISTFPEVTVPLKYVQSQMTAVQMMC